MSNRAIDIGHPHVIHHRRAELAPLCLDVGIAGEAEHVEEAEQVPLHRGVGVAWEAEQAPLYLGVGVFDGAEQTPLYAVVGIVGRAELAPLTGSYAA